MKPPKTTDTRQDDRWARVFLFVLWTLYVSGITAIAIAEDDLWPGLPILLAFPPLASVVRSRWELRRWPHLGPSYLRRSQITSIGKWRGHRIAQIALGWVYVDTQQLVSENPERECAAGIPEGDNG